MLFDSYQYFIFLILVVIFFYLTHPKFRWIVLLFSSCYFYIQFVPLYILFLFFLITLDYFSARVIENSFIYKKLIFLLSIIISSSVLFIFKYYNFFIDNIYYLFDAIGISFLPKHLNWLLPLGLSFHTFQSIGYLIEVYTGRQKAEKHFGIYSLYIMFFPQLVAGPIEKPQQLLQQLKVKIQQARWANIEWTECFRLLLWGLLKKVVIADRLALFVNPLFRDSLQITSLEAWLAALLFACQIYFDFSAYSQMAQGSALLFGVRLSENFKQPYLSQSFSELWRNYHISLTQWFRDYVYISLGGNRQLLIKQMYFLIIVFLLSGLWHGASWCFVLWGLVNAVFMCLELLIKKNTFIKNILFNRVFKFFYPFIIFSVAMVLFRSVSVDQAFGIYKKMFYLNSGLAVNRDNHLLLLCIFLSGGVFLVEYIYKNRHILNNQNLFFYKYSSQLKLFMVYFMFFASLFFRAKTNDIFIYFQF